MKGPNRRFNPNLNPFAPKKRRKKGRKKKAKPTGSTSRDYRGVEGVLKDAQKSK